jgi:hypothetical protein
VNVFVLSTGRCGSTTFERACRHIINYTCAHESRIGTIGEGRLDYPPDHIESDNRLSWFLGRLEQRYPRDVFYVHLQRDREAVARSYAKRLEPGLIIYAYAHGIHLGLPDDIEPNALAIARDYVETVTANIECFLADKPNRMAFQIENAKAEFPQFWESIGARGNLAAALAEFDVAYNASESNPSRP